MAIRRYIKSNKAKMLIGLVLLSLVISIYVQWRFDVSWLLGLRACLSIIVLIIPGLLLYDVIYKRLGMVTMLAVSAGLGLMLIIFGMTFSNLVLKIPVSGLSNIIIVLFMAGLISVVRTILVLRSKTFK